MQSGKVSIPSVILYLILLLLVAVVLFPVFCHRGSPSRKAMCLNNLKQCAQALKMYADDYNGQMPSSSLVSHSKKWNADDARVFCTIVGKLGELKRTWAEVLYGHMKSPDIVFCPSDSVDTKDPNAQTSYWYKVANDKAWYGIGCGTPRKSMSDYGFESDQIAFYEHLGWHWGDTSGLKNGIQINASFIDTHLETIVIQNATSGDPVNCATNSDGEPMYYNTGVDPKTKVAKKQTGPATLTDPACCYDTF